MSIHITGVHSEEQVQAIWESDSAKIFHDYLNLMEDTESPREFLMWSLIAAAAGLLGRNAAFFSGPTHKVTPNLFVILLGPSSIKKSSAINMMTPLLQHTTLNFGPTDTGGQRHGIMSALTGLHRITGAGKVHHPDLGPLTSAMIRPRRSDDIMLVAPELGRLLGTSSVDMANFLNDLYDGAEIDYQTKAGETRLKHPLATVLGATTPANLAGILPENAAGHGIISRIVFVYADKVHKIVALPPEQKEEWWDARQTIIDRLDWIDANRHNIGLDSRARAAYERLYTFKPLTQDPRLESYHGRRGITLIKVAMCIAALRSDTMVIESDVLMAHELLHAIEPKMHKALEYFGRNKAYSGRMAMIEYLRASTGQVATASELIAAASSEMNAREAREAIESMTASGELFVFGDSLALGEIKNELLKKQRDKK